MIKTFLIYNLKHLKFINIQKKILKQKIDLTIRTESFIWYFK